MGEYGAAMVACQSRFHRGKPEGELGIHGLNSNGEHLSAPLL